MFRKILIANRENSQCALFAHAEKWELRRWQCIREADREALHTQLADEAICIGAAPAMDSYLTWNGF